MVLLFKHYQFSIFFRCSKTFSWTEGGCAAVLLNWRVCDILNWCVCGSLIELACALQNELVCVRQSDWIGACAADWIGVCVQQTDWIGACAAVWIGVCAAVWLNWRVCGSLNCFVCGRLIELARVRQAEFVCVRQSELVCVRQSELVCVRQTDSVDFCVADWFNWFWWHRNWIVFHMTDDWIGICVADLSELICVAGWLNFFSVWRGDWIITAVDCCVWLQLVLFTDHSNNFRRLVPTPCISPGRSLSLPLSCWSWGCTAGLQTACLLR